MKKRNIIFGIVLILTAVLILFDAFGITSPLTAALGEVSLLSVLLGFLLIAVCIKRIAKRSFSIAIIALALIFMLFEKNIAFLCGFPEKNIINNWLLLLAAVILAGGLKLLFPKKLKRYKTKFGESTIYLNGSDLIPKKTRYVKNVLGECKIYFENTDAYLGDTTLNIINKLGEMKIFVPASWRVVAKIECVLGENKLPCHNGMEDAPVLNIVGSNKLGELKIIYV